LHLKVSTFRPSLGPYSVPSITTVLGARSFTARHSAGESAAAGESADTGVAAEYGEVSPTVVTEFAVDANLSGRKGSEGYIVKGATKTQEIRVAHGPGSSSSEG
jgi:hypothetical protein